MGFYGMGRELNMLEDAMNAGDVAWWLMELPSGAVFFSPNKITLLGYKEEDISKFLVYTDFTKLLHSDDFDKTMKAMQDHIDGSAEIYEAKYRIKTKNGKYIMLYDRGRVVARKGKEMAIAGVVIDITKHSPGDV